ncbi:MAG: phytanoyl-CoA dioxygenase family protein [Acidimicrobiia bacterium]|nr:phytanoyl-CoA dioxygenase family protein [Acidimicrobiia bacterium]
MTGTPLPHVVCAGTEHAGVDVLRHVLHRRPDVYLGRFDEHRYFDQHFDKGPDWYTRRFDTWDGQSVVADLSSSYFRNPDAHDRIHQVLGAEVLGILVVRQPIVRAWAHYVDQLGRTGTGGSFSDALATPQVGVDPVPVIERFLSAFGDRGLVLVYEDDLEPDPRIGYRAVCHHLGLEEHPVDLAPPTDSLFPHWRAVAAGDRIEGRTVRTDALVLCTHNDLVRIETEPTTERIGETARSERSWTRTLTPDEADTLNGRHFAHVVIDAEELLGRELGSWRRLPPIPEFADAPFPARRLTHVGILAHTSAPSGPTFSTFGGNWIDTGGFADELATRVADGRIDPELAERLREFERDGRTVLPGAVDDDVIDAIFADVDAAWAPDSGYLARNSVTGLMPAHFGRGQGRIIDAHMNSEAVRRAAFAPRLLEFLRTLFDDDAVAFQSLYFERGSEQAMHQDTAYVVTDEPMRIAAAWIALEDVEPGSGELEYYLGSHRREPFLFSGAHRSFTPSRDGDAQHQAFLAHLHTVAERDGVQGERFLPRRGDVLLWHADLAHGGAPVTDPAATRHSVVVHYTPRSSRPNYAPRGRPYPIHQVAPGGFVSSNNFRVADLRDGGPVRPRPDLDLRHERGDVRIDPLEPPTIGFEVRLDHGLDARGVIVRVRGVADGDRLELVVPKTDGSTTTRVADLTDGHHDVEIRVHGVDGDRPLLLRYPDAGTVDLEQVSVIELLRD